MCCTSDFGSKCCKPGSSCSPGCRNSLKGACGCVAEPSWASVGFDLSQAVHVLGMNAASQCPSSAIRGWDCVACSKNYSLTELNVTEEGGHLAFTAWDEDTHRIQVVMRGSLSIQDWLSDVNFPLTPAYSELGCSGCGVHRGLLEAFQKLQPGVEASVEALLRSHPNATISITGHSLGAALAAHTAIAMKLVRGWDVAHTIYTFGQPRMGDKPWAAWFMSKFPGWLRSVHWNDPVPHVPLASMLNYRHVGREMWWTEDSKAAMIGNDSGEDPNCSASIVAALVPTDHWYYLGYRVCGCVPFQKS